MATHENFSRNDAAKPPSERSFGLVFALVFAVIALLPLWRGRPLRLWALGVSFVMLMLGLLAPSVLRVPNRIWFGFSEMLNRLTTPIFMALLFFAIFTPFALVLRLIGKDVLRLRFDPRLPSYWIERQPPGPQPASMVEQF